MQSNAGVGLRGKHNGHSRLVGVIGAVALLLALFLPASPASAAGETTGTDFWVAFNTNYQVSELTLFISGSVATSGTVTPLGSAAIPFSVTPGTVTSVVVPDSYQLTADDGIEDKGVHVQAGAPVSVYGLNRVQYSTDAFLAIPTEAAGTVYRTLGYAAGPNGSTGFGVVATDDGTTVTITPSVEVAGHPAGTPYTVDLNRGQTYQLKDSADSSGSTITSNKPISVYGFHECANVPVGFSFCDHIVEQLPPTSAWGTSFLAVRLANRTAGDTYRVLADQDGTVLTIDGTEVATLAAGELHEVVLPAGASGASNSGIQIQTSKPALVAQYSNGTDYDNVTSDPFMMLIPPYEQFQSSYTVTTPASGFNINFLNLVVRTSDIASFRLDGSAVDASAFAPIPGTSFSSAQIPVSLGSHTVSNATPFGVFVYGFADDDSYGYPGGYLLSPIASAASMTLDQSAYSATVDEEICPVATVVDSGGAPLAGLNVVFTVDTPEVSASAVTDAQGQASVCFTNAAASTGTLTASTGLAVGSLTATASVEFTGPPPPPPSTDPSVPGPDGQRPTSPSATPVVATPRYAG